MISTIEKLFTEIGGTFLTDIRRLKSHVQGIKAYLFDWDGVFNDGYKDDSGSSPFAEPDSMATNMLRFGYWLQHGSVPFTGVITGENNQLSLKLAQREHFNAVFLRVKHKELGLQFLEKEYGIMPHEICYFFDDVLDLNIAAKVGARMLINRSSSPMFSQYVIKNKLADYITAHSGQEHGLREACELIMALAGNYNTVLDERIAFSQNYQDYLAKRQEINLSFYTQKENQIELYNSKVGFI